jgi:L-cysteate sulfo-lyase
VRCELVFEKRVDTPSDPYLKSGNVFLDRLYGAGIREVEKGSDMTVALEAVADELRSAGETPYVIPGGGSNKVGALGYVDCAYEFISQANRMGLVIDNVIHATGSAGTQAGLIAGLKASHSGIPLLGIGVNASQDIQEERVFKLAVETAELIGAPGVVNRADVVADCNYIGDGYGVPTEAMNEAVLLLARIEGILFDPVYTGKALAGMIDLIRKKKFSRKDNLLFIHTGGSAGLFGYSDRLRTRA